ncbi:MAG TPA: S1 RNA-binding domain-containing protein [Pseudobdellovibrionaceae bacterium]|nr:S1 RNA-binding domain-containing protein [Pseudobdellovibrionaceae bacterium]
MKDIFGDDIEIKNTKNKNEDTFAEMFANSEKSSPGSLRVGAAFSGELLTFGKDESFISTGGQQDALIFTKELLDKDLKPLYKVGDLIEVVVTLNKGDELRVSRKGITSVGAAEDLEDAFDMELPIEGKVLEAVKGGFRVSVMGKTAFCPISQIDNKFVEDVQPYVGQKFEFLITQFEEKGRNIIISRKKLLSLQKAEAEGTFIQDIKVGEIVPGKITRLEKFGAFVDLGHGVEGLVHISELGWSRLQHPDELVSAGQEIHVKILKMEDANGKLKISLSLKQAAGEGDPWNSIVTQFPVGSVVTGTVEKKETYGLFVQLTPGITGLLPKSKWRDSSEANTYENKKRGDKIQVRVDEINFADKKMSLGLPIDGEDRSWESVTQNSGGSLGTLAEKLQLALKK